MANILVTGTSRGIGKAIVAALSAHKVVGHSSRGGDGLIAADLARSGAAEGLWHQALEALGGRIDVLVNNAGIFEPAAVDLPADEWTAQWERTMRVNLTAAAELCRLAILHFREEGGGRIVNVASRAAHRGDSPAHWHYAASKGGMIAMTKTIARGYAADNILAFAVSPGFTASEMVEEYMASRGGGGSGRDGALARGRRPRFGDGRGDRRQRRELCPLIPSLRGAQRRGNPASARPPTQLRIASLRSQ